MLKLCGKTSGARDKAARDKVKSLGGSKKKHFGIKAAFGTK